MAVFPLNHYRATAPPWSPHSESEALTCVGIASPREFNQNLDFQLLWCSEIENCILLPCLLSAVASWKALLTTSCPQLFLAAKPSELALNLKVSCVSAAQSSYSAWPSSAPTSVHALICCIDLWVSLEQKGLPWFMIRNLKIRRKKKWLSSMKPRIFLLWDAGVLRISTPHLRQSHIKLEVGRHRG